MISEESFQTIMAFADEAVRTEWGPAREREALIQACNELGRAYHRSRELAVAMVAPDENVRQLRAARRLVDDAVQHHAEAAMTLLRGKPAAGQYLPDMPSVEAQWHLCRAQALQLLPVTDAARLLREEAHAALDTNPKDTT